MLHSDINIYKYIFRCKFDALVLNIYILHIYNILNRQIAEESRFRENRLSFVYWFHKISFARMTVKYLQGKIACSMIFTIYNKELPISNKINYCYQILTVSQCQTCTTQCAQLELRVASLCPDDMCTRRYDSAPVCTVYSLIYQGFYLCS